MVRITPDLIKGLITRNGNLYVPEYICDAIGSCVVSDPVVVQKEGERLKALYESYQTKLEPIKTSYLEDATIDAYSIYYLPRNTLVPKLALLVCAYHRTFQALPNKLRVLDLGSGTGGVILGLLDLFQNEPLSKISLDITAVDSSPGSLQRQRQLVNCVAPDSSVRCIEADLTSPKDYRPKLSTGTPYDMVFAANILTELEEPVIFILLQDVAGLLSENGLLISVESARDYTGQQFSRINKNAVGLGLNIYYPCPPQFSCQKPKCWMWREDEFECPDISVSNESVATTTVQKAYWLILCKQSCSVFDMLLERNPTYTWGIKAHIGKERTTEDKVEQEYEVCTPEGLRKLVHKRGKDQLFVLLESEPHKRGSFIGWTADFSVVETWDPISGFKVLKSKGHET